MDRQREYLGIKDTPKDTPTDTPKATPQDSPEDTPRWLEVKEYTRICINRAYACIEH